MIKQVNIKRAHKKFKGTKLKENNNTATTGMFAQCLHIFKLLI